MATGVYVGGGAYCLVGKVEGMLVIVTVQMSKEGGFGSESVGSVRTGVSASWDGACEGVNHVGCG